MENKKISIICDWNIVDVFNELEKGNMKIPRFQRGYVWERAKIVKLLNSIYAEHPIGTFFIWEASAEYGNYCRELDELEFPPHPSSGKFQFIIDGQQRITSLYVALKGKKLERNDYASICFNLDKECFLVPRLKTEPNNIPAWKIFNTETQMALISDYSKADAQNGTKYAFALQKCRMILDKYPISIIKTLNVELEEAVTIFENINQGGKRLTLFDLVHASVWSPDFDLRKAIERFNETPIVKLFGGLSEETFTQAIALNAKNNCQKINQLHLTNQECKDFWDRTAECLRLSIDFVKALGAQRVDILPYEAILPVLQYYYFLYGKSSMENSHKQLITDWFWSTTFSKRYSSSTLTRQKEDADWIADIVAGASTSRIFAITITLKELLGIQMKHKSVVKNGVLCILASNNPLDFNKGSKVNLDNTNASRANAKENHHFFPFSRHGDFNIKVDEVNSLLNFAFISKALNQEILNKLPSQYLALYEEKSPTLRQWLITHFIDESAFDAAKDNRFNDFVETRGMLLLEKINALCKVSSQDENKINIFNEEDTDIETVDIANVDSDLNNCRVAINNSEICFYCKNTRGANATAFFRADGIYVQPGSECVIAITASGKKGGYIEPTRQRLLKENILIEANGKLVFAQEYKFKTPSGASDIVLGAPSNGWICWKDTGEETLDAHFRQKSLT